MQRLVEKIRELQKGEIGKLVRRRTKEFSENGRKPGREIFKELCFCILTANFNAERSIMIQERAGGCFFDLPKEKLAGKLKELGHRYPNARAGYICEARPCAGPLLKALKSLRGEELREWIVKNVKGIGYKEASHFLRNIGREDYAIIDFHIIDLLVREGLIERPKTLSRKKYLEIEAILRKIAKAAGVSLAELDLYLWYMETGKILK